MTPEDEHLDALERHLGLEEPSDGEGGDRLSPRALAWAGRLDPLYDRLPEVTPSEAGLERLHAALAVHAPRPRSAPVRRDLRAWQAATAALGLIAACLAVIVLLPKSEPAPPAAPAAAAEPASSYMVLTAALQGEAGREDRPAFVLAAIQGGEVVRSTPANAVAVPDHSYQLWLVTPEGPVHLGLLSPSIVHSVAIPDAVRPLLVPGSRLILSLDAGDIAGSAPVRVVAEGEFASL